MTLTETLTLVLIWLSPGIRAAVHKTLSSQIICSSHFRRTASTKEVGSKANQLLPANLWAASRRRERGRSMLTTPSFWIKWFKSWIGNRTKSKASYAYQKLSHSLNKAKAVTVRNPSLRQLIWLLKWLTQVQAVPWSLQPLFIWVMHRIDNSPMSLINNNKIHSWNWLRSCIRVQKQGRHALDKEQSLQAALSTNS